MRKYLLFCCIASLLLFARCGNLDVFEKDVPIPDHQWSNSFKPEISFDVADTTAHYNIYLVLRHTDAYRYNNIYLNLYTKVPGNDSLRSQRLDLRLATDDKGWLGSGMDDIFEHRILITGTPQQLSRPGTYTFRIENIMREDPLQFVMNVGIRVEKTKS